MAQFFNRNLKYIRKLRGMSQEELAIKSGIDRSSISRWENENMDATLDKAITIANVLKIPITQFISSDLTTDDKNIIDMLSDTVEIPVLGKVHAGIAIQAQENIINYIDIPSSWCKDKQCFGLLIEGDCMEPKYSQGDVVIFKLQTDCESGQDCAVAINGDYEATFKKVIKNEKGIILQPYNEKYEMLVFNNEEVLNLPIQIIGVAFKKFGDV